MDTSGVVNFFAGIPRLTRTIGAGLFGVLILGIIFPGLQTVFALNIGRTIPYLWNIFTSGFFEIYFFTGVINILLLLYAGRFLEPIWGSKEFLRFICVVNLGAGIGSFFMVLILYAMIFDLTLLYESNLCGFSGVIASFTVALKQLLPEQEIQVFYVVPVRMNQLPGLIALTTFALYVFGVYPHHHLPHVIFGMVTSWIYLRFYQKKAEVVGDMSKEFAFATFFPEPIQPIIGFIATLFYKITYVPLRFIGVVPQRTRPANNQDSYNDILSNTVVSTNSADVERRRMLAAKALDARIQAAKNNNNNNNNNNNDYNNLSSSSPLAPNILPDSPPITPDFLPSSPLPLPSAPSLVDSID